MALIVCLGPVIFQLSRDVLVGVHSDVCSAGPTDSMSVGNLHLGPDH